MAFPDKAELCLFVVLAILGLFPPLAPAQNSEVFYAIKEELAPGTVFGYIVDDSDLRRKVSPDELGSLSFSFLTTGNPNSKYFSIAAKTGLLSVATRIDRETVCSFRLDCQLKVSAVVQSELGPFFYIILVQVEVTDINDNPPTFSQPLFQLTIPENAALGRTFPLPTAFDKDTGTNNTVKDYYLMSGSGHFTLNTRQDDVGNMQTSLKLVRHLNREDTASITVLVGARDGGRPPLTGTLTVRVTVADVNDNHPVFDKYAYNVNVSETTRTNEPLLKVHAQDADVGANGNLSYSFSLLQPQEVLDLFRMEEISGTIYLARSVENHTGRIFEMVVEASDQGAPPKVSRALVRVRVLDTVNSRPDIIVDILRSSTNGQSEVSEYAEVGKVVAYVSVSDPDSGENGVTVCRLNTKDFELQPLNNQGQYKVILVTNLDRERISRYEISVSCTDFGFPPLDNSKTFQVNVRDENDHAPQFSQRNYFTTIRENATAGAIITTLVVTDADVGRNAEVTYRVAGAHRDEFRILDNGTMVSTAPLDREVSDKLVVKVLAVDKGFPPLSGSATIMITLEDVNDMAPRFSDRGYSFSVAESAKVGTFVGIVAATDDDEGLNAELEFLPSPQLAESGLPAFTITKDGVVKTSRPVDREKKDIHYLAVVARDGGHPSLSATTTLTIHIDDVNDNTPYFVYPSENNDTLSIPHTFPTRTPMTQVRATDRDAGQNAAIVYSCASANDSSLFGMDPHTGDLFLQRYLGRRQVGTYILRVAAHDEGTPQLSNQTLLFLDVYFDNSTLLDPAQAVAPPRAMVTVLIVVGVVLVLVVVVVIAFICIRRQEARKKQAASSGEQQATPTKMQGGYYIAPGVCESPVFGGISNGSLNKPVPEQCLESNGMPSVPRLTSDASNLRTTNPYVIMPPHSSYTDSDGPPEIIEISRSGLFHRSEDAYPEDELDQADGSHFSTFRSQDGAYSSSFRQNSLPRHPVEEMDDAKRADDTLSLSELSYQSTSDSGRGGSEFDVNNAGHKDKVAKTSSPLPRKGHSNASGAFRPREPEVSFTTFRGQSPCSFRFGGDSDSDTLTRSQRQAGNNPQPHYQALGRGLQSTSPTVFRPLLPSYSGGDSSDESSSLGRKSTAVRRPITPGTGTADLASNGYVSGPGLGLGLGLGSGEYTPSHEQSVCRGEGRGGGNGGGMYGADSDRSRSRSLPATSTFSPAPHPGHQHHHHQPHQHHELYSGNGNTVPPMEFRGRNNLGMTSSPRRHVPDYVNSYSDMDSGDDTRHGADDAREIDRLLPPYPDLLEEGEEEVVGEGQVSERSALNFIPGFSNTSRCSEDSFRTRRSSEV